MSSTLVGTTAGQISTRTLGATKGLNDTQIVNAMRLVTVDKIQPPPAGLTNTQLVKFYQEAWMDELMRYSVQEATKNGIRERAAQKQALDDAAAADAGL